MTKIDKNNIKRIYNYSLRIIICNFDPICDIVIYFLLVLNFATVICVLSIHVKL